MIRKMSILIMLVCSIVLLPSGIANAAALVEGVSVNVVSPDVPMPSRVAKRMNASVSTVAEQVIVGRKVEEVSANQQAYEKIIQDVFDRVLFGYSVQSVTILPDTDTSVTVAIKPWGDVVREVTLDMDAGALSPEALALIKEDLGNIEGKVDDVLLGLPVDAIDWAGGVSKLAIRDILNEQLPEFRGDIELVPGVHTVVKLSLLPAGPVVQDVNISMRSRSLPNLLLDQLKPTVEETAKVLTGLPVAFVERHADYFQAKLAKEVAGQRTTRRYGLTFNPAIYAGTNTEIVLDAETDKYNIFMEGRLDMGRKEDNTSFLLHAGQYFTKRDEAFLEMQFIPGNVTWQFIPGWGHRVGRSLITGFKYDTSAKQSIQWMNQQLNRNWMLRLERRPGNGETEVGVRYKMHDYLSAEYVFNHEDKWLRLVGNL